MSLSQKVRLDLDDGRQIEATYDGRDLRAWEAKFRRSALVEQLSLSQLTWLGWSAAVRSGAVDGELKDYAKFDEVCVSVEGVRDDEEPPDPPIEASPTTPGDDSSAPSP